MSVERSRAERVWRFVLLVCWVSTFAIALVYGGLWIRELAQ